MKRLVMPKYAYYRVTVWRSPFMIDCFLSKTSILIIFPGIDGYLEVYYFEKEKLQGFYISTGYCTSMLLLLHSVLLSVF